MAVMVIASHPHSLARITPSTTSLVAALGLAGPQPSLFLYSARSGSLRMNSASQAAGTCSASPPTYALHKHHRSSRLSSAPPITKTSATPNEAGASSHLLNLARSAPGSHPYAAWPALRQNLYSSPPSPISMTVSRCSTYRNNASDAAISASEEP